MAGVATPTDSFHFIGSKGDAFLEYVLKLDPAARKPYFDMLTRLRLGDNGMISGLSSNGRPERAGLIELKDHSGARIYGMMDSGHLVVFGASGKGDQDKAIQKAISARKEYEELKREGRLDPKRHTKFHFHTTVEQGHKTLGGKPATEFADRHGHPHAPEARPQDQFNHGAKRASGARGGRMAVVIGALTVTLQTLTTALSALAPDSATAAPAAPESKQTTPNRPPTP